MAKKKNAGRQSKISKAKRAAEMLSKMIDDIYKKPRKKPASAAKGTPKPTAAQLRSPLMRCGRRHGWTQDGWVNVMADHEVCLHITGDEGGIRGHASACLTAVALTKSVLGPHITGAEVGTNITKVWDADSKTQVSFHTSTELGRAVRKWDKTGVWPLPPGLYWLRRYPDSLRPGYKVKTPRTRCASKNKRKAPPARTLMNLRDLHRLVKAAEEAAAAAKKKRKK